jgi:hypothetical protein
MKRGSSRQNDFLQQVLVDLPKRFLHHLSPHALIGLIDPLQRNDPVDRGGQRGDELA